MVDQIQDLAIRCIQKNIKKNHSVKDWPWWKLFTTVRPLIEVQLTEEQIRGKDVSTHTHTHNCAKCEDFSEFQVFLCGSVKIQFQFNFIFIVPNHFKGLYNVVLVQNIGLGSSEEKKLPLKEDEKPRPRSSASTAWDDWKAGKRSKQHKEQQTSSSFGTILKGR